MNNEPVLTATSITATIIAVFNVLVVTKAVDLTPEAIAAINVAIGSVIALLFAVWARNKVSPV